MVIKDFTNLLGELISERINFIGHHLSGEIFRESFVIAVLDEILYESKVDFPMNTEETGFTESDVHEMIKDLEATALLIEEAFHTQLEKTEWDNDILTKFFTKTAK